jgi:hypothetical protein
LQYFSHTARKIKEDPADLEKRQIALNEAVADLIIDEFVPFSVAYGKGIYFAFRFRLLLFIVAINVWCSGMKKIIEISSNSGLRAPGRKLLNTHINKLMKQTKYLIFNKLISNPCYAVMFDGWSSSRKHEFTLWLASLIDEDWNLASYCLGMVRTQGTYTITLFGIA